MKPAALLGIALAAALAVHARLASADAVPPAPEQCPDGSRGQTCHGIGGHCEPKTCTSDADCEDGDTCKQASLCVDTGACGGLMPPDAAPPPSRDIVTGACPTGSGCTAPATCKELTVCVGPAGDSGSGSDSGSGCSCRTAGAADAPAGGSSTLALLAAIALLARRRCA